MIDVTTLTNIFHEKLQRTKSFDAAFVKAVWTAYLTGFKDGVEPMAKDVGLNYEIMSAQDLLRWAKPQTPLEVALMKALEKELKKPR